MRYWCCLLLLAVALSYTHPAQAQPFDRRQMLETLTMQVILPYHQALYDQSQALDQAAHAYQADPTPENLAVLQQAWKDASLAWERCEWLDFGRLMIYHTPIERVPTKIEALDEALAGSDTLNADFVAGSGSNLKGLPALEYLIFAPDVDLTDPRRIDYIVGMTETLVEDTKTLYDAWSPDGDNYAETFINADGAGTVVRESLSMLNNQMVAELEKILQNKLGKPLGIFYEDGLPRPELVETPYSGESVAHIRANLESLQAMFTQDWTLRAYLTYLGAMYEENLLGDVIMAQFEASYAALDAIQLPLEVAVVEDPASVQAAYDAIHQLMVLIRVDMAGQLGVTITFNDNDGD